MSPASPKIASLFLGPSYSYDRLL